MNDLVHLLCCPCHHGLDDMALWAAPLLALASLVLSQLWSRIAGAKR